MSPSSLPSSPHRSSRYSSHFASANLASLERIFINRLVFLLFSKSTISYQGEKLPSLLSSEPFLSQLFPSPLPLPSRRQNLGFLPGLADSWIILKIFFLGNINTYDGSVSPRCPGHRLKRFRNTFSFHFLKKILNFLLFTVSIRRDSLPVTVSFSAERIL